MSRVVLAGFVVAALVACKGDSEPTSPVSSASASDAFSVGAPRGDIEVAQEGKPHQSNDVEAVVVITHNRGHFRNCNGTDGFYAENHQINTGTVTGDPRLTGAIEMRVTEIVHFGGDIWTPSFGTFVIRDAGGRTKAEGDYNAWAHNEAFEGTFVGRVRNADGQLGGNLIANVSVVFGDNGSFVIRVGGVSPPESRMTAGIFAGTCSGKFTEYDSDVPAPAAVSTAQTRTSRAVPQLWQSFQR